jgi:hypothetical protein
MLDDTDILSLKKIRDGLDGQRLLLVADATGLSYPTVNKLATGEVENYSYDTVKRISRWIGENV